MRAKMRRAAAGAILGGDAGAGGAGLGLRAKGAAYSDVSGFQKDECEIAGKMRTPAPISWRGRRQ
jgi:hypothetical protein